MDELIGSIFGTWLVIEKVPNTAWNYWECECTVCGQRQIISESLLKKGNYPECSEHNNNPIATCELCGNDFALKDNTLSRKYCYDCLPSFDEVDYYPTGRRIFRTALERHLKLYKGGVCEYCGESDLNKLGFYYENPLDRDYFITDDAVIEEISLPLLEKEVSKCVLICEECAEQLER